MKGVNENEKNLSAQEKDEKQSARIQEENGFHGRQKGFEKAQKQGQKAFDLLILETEGEAERAARFARPF